MTPFARIYKFNTKLHDCVRNFSYTPVERIRNRRTTFSAVHSGQRLYSVLGPWNDGLSARFERTGKQPVQPFRRKIRQVAGNNQIPARVRCGQSGRDSCQRSVAGTVRPALGLRFVRYRAQSELPVSLGGSDNCDFGDERLEQSGRVNDQRVTPEIEKTLVATHARAGAPRKNKPSDLAIALHRRPAILRLSVGLAQRPEYTKGDRS
jgi:hypothetical protein